MHSSQTITQGIHHSPTNHITSPAECQQIWQVMKILFSETVSSDPKISAMHFRAELARLGLVPQATHHFLDVMDLGAGRQHLQSSPSSVRPKDLPGPRAEHNSQPQLQPARVAGYSPWG